MYRQLYINIVLKSIIYVTSIIYVKCLIMNVCLCDILIVYDNKTEKWLLNLNVKF